MKEPSFQSGIERKLVDICAFGIRSVSRRAGVIVIAFILAFFTIEVYNRHFDPRMNIDPFVYPPFEPDIKSDFPVVSTKMTNSSPIPKIIHQIWNDYIIPTQLVDNIPVLLDNHPNWEYRFWTLSAGRLFIENNFPKLLEVYDSYDEPIDKSDLLRYAILFQYGGVFLDLDFYILRPLDRIVASYPCVVVPEPPEHATYLYNVDFYLANGVMFTRPSHPFFGLILNNVAAFRHNERPCGTRMFTSNYLIYNRTLENQSKIAKNSVFVASSKYFLYDIDPGLHKYFRKSCRNLKDLNFLKQRGCASFYRNFVLRNEEFQFAYTKHLWAHTIKQFQFDEKNDIRNVAPSAKLYTADDD